MTGNHPTPEENDMPESTQQNQQPPQETAEEKAARKRAEQEAAAALAAEQEAAAALAAAEAKAADRAKQSQAHDVLLRQHWTDGDGNARVPGEKVSVDKVTFDALTNSTFGVPATEAADGS